MFNKLKELSKDTAVYGISTIVGRFLGFLLVPFYTNVFPTDEFGIYATVYAYLAFFNILFIYGMDAAFMKYASIADEKEKKDIFSTPIIFITFTSILLVGVIYLLKAPLQQLMFIPERHSQLLNYVVFIILFDTIALIPFGHLRLQRKAGKFALIKILNIGINLVLNVILVLGYNYGIEAIFISNLAASAFSLLAVSPDILKYLKFRLRKDILIKMLQFGIPYLPASLAAMIVQVIDRPILRYLTDESTVGIYQANYKLGIFMMLFVSMFQYAWQPFFLTNAQEKNAKDIFAKVLTLFTITSSLIWIVLTLFIDDLASIEFWNGKTIIGKEFLPGLSIVPIILLAYIFHGMYVNFQAGIYIEEKTKYFPLVTGAGALVNLLMNFLLIPVIGIYGAAYATLASYVVMSAGLFITSQRFYKIKYEFAKIFKLFSLIIFTILIYYYLLNSGQLIFVYKIIILGGFLLCMFVLRIIRFSEIKNLSQLIKNRS
ncbi:MAG: oligosaccharide flippase family protein [Melioribacteraceae bacterium]|nr:oligosaccharide flippase family protein [Melioribacteraceae bacterium]MCF8355723.1 oligosaccharide flippase family protein [Melioribacteraceae bacterium]MCF8393841.1 oligosaccharide flippase family protein [Melioribacteraceae bacterium]MCF8418214.1 oligosaccharide flippase family protein [Melioribacteraceae bacterium]